MAHICNLDLKSDKELLAANFYRFIHSGADVTNEQPNIVSEYSFLTLSIKKVHELVQKAVKVYKELQGDSVVMLNDAELIAHLEGRSLSSIIKYNPVRLKDELTLQYIFYQVCPF